MTLQKVQSGDKLRIPAEFFNTCIDMAEVFQKTHHNQTPGKSNGHPSELDVRIQMRNSSGGNLAQFSPVALGDLIITPERNEQAFRNNTPVFEYAEAEAKKLFGILQQPLVEDEVGDVLLVGITPVRMMVSSESHKYADLGMSGGLKSAQSGNARILWKEDIGDDKWAILLLGAPSSGSVYAGYFAVSDSSNEDDGLKVTVSKGKCWVLETCYTVSETELAVSGTGYVWLKVKDDSAPELQFLAADLNADDADVFKYENGVFKAVIATVELNDDGDAIREVIQQQYGVVYAFVYNICSSSSEET